MSTACSNDFVFEHALLNVFCFPFYIYPLLFIPNAIILRLFSHWNHRFKSKNDSFYIDPSQKIKMESLYGLERPVKPFICPDNFNMITNYFKDHTPLSHDLISLVINEFCYDPQYEIYIKYKHKKRRYNLFRDLFAWYLILTFIFHALSFIVILYTNIEWIMMDEHNILYASEFHSLCLSTFAFHPSSKVFNLINIGIIYVDISGKQYYSCLFPFSFLVVVILIDVILFLMYFDFLRWIMFFAPFYSLLLGIAQTPNIVAIMRWFHTSFGIWQQCLIVSSFYCMLLILYSWDSCLVYIEDWWTLHGPWIGNIFHDQCLLRSFASPYCPNVNGINVNWNDWRSYIMIISWLLF